MIRPFYGNKDHERTFDFFQPEMFTDPAYREAGLTPEDFGARTIRMIRYAVQLAIVVHRPNFVRDLEESDQKAAWQAYRQKVEARTKPGQETISFYGIEITTEEFNEAEENAKNHKRYMEEEGGWELALKRHEVVVNKAKRNHRQPYHPYKGYYLSHEVDHLALAQAGMTMLIENWDWQQDTSAYRSSSYPDRYEAWFQPPHFIEESCKDIHLAEPSNEALQIASRSLESILSTYGPETRQRHEKLVESRAASEAKFRNLRVELVLPDPRSQTVDFENIKPSDFQD